MTADKADDRERRAARLAAALKENLKRRKAQARGRAAQDEAPGATAEGPRDRPRGDDER